MKNANYIQDTQPSYSPTFNVESRKMWKDKLPFQIFDGSGYLTDGAKNYIRTNRDELERFKKDNTWGDAILAHAEFKGIGGMVTKSAPSRADVKVSGSVHMEAHMDASDRGDSYDPQRQQNNSAANFDNDGELTKVNYFDHYRVNGRNIEYRTVKAGETRLITAEEADQWYNESINNN